MKKAQAIKAMIDGQTVKMEHSTRYHYHYDGIQFKCRDLVTNELSTVDVNGWNSEGTWETHMSHRVMFTLLLKGPVKLDDIVITLDGEGMMVDHEGRPVTLNFS